MSKNILIILLCIAIVVLGINVTKNNKVEESFVKIESTDKGVTFPDLTNTNKKENTVVIDSKKEENISLKEEKIIRTEPVVVVDNIVPVKEEPKKEEISENNNYKCSVGTLSYDSNMKKYICTDTWKYHFTESTDYSCTPITYSWDCPYKNTCVTSALVSDYNNCIKEGCTVSKTYEGTPIDLTKEMKVEEDAIYKNVCVENPKTNYTYMCAQGWKEYSGTRRNLICYKEAEAK